MFQFASRRLALLTLLMALTTSVSIAAQRPIVSSMKNVRAVMESRGYFITPAYESAGQIIPGDEAPAQAFQIVCPTESRVTIGRLFTSCSCVQLEAAKTTFERGEPVVLTLRNVRPTPPNGQTYAIYVQLTSPVRTTLRYDTFVQSDRFIVSEPVVVASAQMVDTSDPEYVSLPEEWGADHDLVNHPEVTTAVQTDVQYQATESEVNVLSEEPLVSATSIVSSEDTDETIGNVADDIEEELSADDVDKAASQTNDESLNSI